MDEDVSKKVRQVKGYMLEILTPDRAMLARHRINENTANAHATLTAQPVIPLQSYNFITEDIVLGNKSLAENKPELKRLGITHVVNACQGTRVLFGQVNTNQEYYDDTGIMFIGIENIMDRPKAQLFKHFERIADFIDGCIQSKGKLFIHCHQGISRSATLLIAYFMIKRGISLLDAIAIVRGAREVQPNDGFLQQLIELEISLLS